VASGAYRRKLGGDASAEEHSTFASVSANVYFDRGRHFAVGLDLETGQSPKNNFDDQRSTGVGLKIKF
jgi:hypothetical protein